jgi:Spy/CpxP family protein refolding chaperone
MTLTGQTKAKIWLVLVAVFVLGAVTGGALTGLYRSRASSSNAGRDSRDRAMKERFEKLRQELNLTDQQTTQVRAILEELRPRFDEPRLKARTRIRELLNTDQQKKFDALVAQQDAEHNAHDADNGKR